LSYFYTKKTARMDSFNKLCSVFMLRDAVDYRGLFFHTLTFGGLVQLHLLHLFDDTHSLGFTR